MRLEIVETVSNLLSNKRSKLKAHLRQRPMRNLFTSKAASTSRSCTCTQAAAPEHRATNTAVGAQNKVGTTENTTCGRQITWPIMHGELLQAKLKRCKILRILPDVRDTHTGHRHTSTTGANMSEVGVVRAAVCSLEYFHAWYCGQTRDCGLKGGAVTTRTSCPWIASQRAISPVNFPIPTNSGEKLRP